MKGKEFMNNSQYLNNKYGSEFIKALQSNRSIFDNNIIDVAQNYLINIFIPLAYTAFMLLLFPNYSNPNWLWVTGIVTLISIAIIALFNHYHFGYIRKTIHLLHDPIVHDMAIYDGQFTMCSMLSEDDEENLNIINKTHASAEKLGELSYKDLIRYTNQLNGKQFTIDSVLKAIDSLPDKLAFAQQRYQQLNKIKQSFDNFDKALTQPLKNDQANVVKSHIDALFTDPNLLAACVYNNRVLANEDLRILILSDKNDDEHLVNIRNRIFDNFDTIIDVLDNLTQTITRFHVDNVTEANKKKQMEYEAEQKAYRIRGDVKRMDTKSKLDYFDIDD